MRTDGVTLEVLKNYFNAIVEGMGYVLERTAYTTFIKETADFTTGLASISGEFFAYPRNIGVSSFVGLDLSKAIIAGEPYREGDILITNDPYSTNGVATHLPDIHLIKPVFFNGEVQCYTWCFIHCSDVGGLVAASISPRAYEIYQEGLRIPPRKLYRAGVLNEDIQQLFQANCRIPDQNWGDLKAMVASLNSGERRLQQLMQKFGPATVRAAMDDLLDYVEERTRKLIQQIPQGDYRFWDYMDDDIASEVPVRIAVTVKVREDQVILDFTGTDPQVSAALNLPTLGVKHPFLCVGVTNFLASLDPRMPRNGGLLRPISVVAPKGTLLNPEFPAACGVRYATVHRIYDTVQGALGLALPEMMPAAGAGQGCMVVLSMPDLETGKRLVTVLEPLHGGGGGGLRRGDGTDMNDHSSGYLKNTPIESLEVHIPVVVLANELIPDSGGPGQMRGGLGNRLEFQVFNPGSVVTARGMERNRFQPWGMAGGLHTASGTAVLNPGTPKERNLGKIDILHLEPGDVVSMRAPGGGGWGSPLRRDPLLVAADVRAGVVTPESAFEHYGVVVKDGEADLAATEQIRAQRLLGAPTGYDWGPFRSRYEQVWSDAMTTALSSLLMTLPVPMRAWAKREIHNRVDRLGTDRQPSPEDLPEIWAEVRQAMEPRDTGVR